MLKELGLKATKVTNANLKMKNKLILTNLERLMLISKIIVKLVLITHLKEMLSIN